METSSEDFNTQIREKFEVTLNEHGYSFQQSLIQAANDLFTQNKSGWRFLASEFPVEIRGRGTRIDFVLQRVRQNEGGLSTSDKSTTLMIAECKRANPAYSNWCFAKSKYLLRNQLDNDYLVFDKIVTHSQMPISEDSWNLKLDEVCAARSHHQKIYRNTEHAYHIGVAVKGTKNGNTVSGDPGKDAIEVAASQVCTGLNGMVNFLAYRESLWIKSPPVTLIPVIFTTANLWVSNADLSTADLKTGDLSFAKHDFHPEPWLFFQYHLSPGIKHGIAINKIEENTLPDIMQSQYIRSIPVVSPSGIEAFYRYATSLDLQDW